VVLAATDDYESIFRVLGAIMGLGAVALFLVLRSEVDEPVLEEG
jgi:hypothetical protein